MGVKNREIKGNEEARLDGPRAISFRNILVESSPFGKV